MKWTLSPFQIVAVTAISVVALSLIGSLVFVYFRCRKPSLSKEQKTAAAAMKVEMKMARIKDESLLLEEALTTRYPRNARNSRASREFVDGDSVLY